MPGVLPDGEPVPADGTLPESAYGGLGTRPFGVYVHVPFCTTRCGYCDFNTYTAAELGGGVGTSVSAPPYPHLPTATWPLPSPPSTPPPRRGGVGAPGSRPPPPRPRRAGGRGRWRPRPRCLH